MRYWKLEDHTFGTSSDDVDLSLLDARAVELTEQQWTDQTAALAAGSALAANPPITTSLEGNKQVHVTNPQARLVTINVVGPVGGPVRARPTVDGVPISGGGGPIRYTDPGVALRIETRAGNNDLVIVEEF